MENSSANTEISRRKLKIDYEESILSGSNTPILTGAGRCLVPAPPCPPKCLSPCLPPKKPRNITVIQSYRAAGNELVIYDPDGCRPEENKEEMEKCRMEKGRIENRQIINIKQSKYPRRPRPKKVCSVPECERPDCNQYVVEKCHNMFHKATDPQANSTTRNTLKLSRSCICSDTSQGSRVRTKNS